MNRLLLFTSLFFSASLSAQPQVVDFKQLEQFLPKEEFANYSRGKIDGETSTMMGFTTSWAQVQYSSIGDSNKNTISIKITDMLNISSYMSIKPSTSGNPDTSAGSEHRRTLDYKNMSVIETYDTTLHQAKLQVSLATRFLIEISGDGVADSGALYPFLDKTDTDGLKAIARKDSNRIK